MLGVRRQSLLRAGRLTAAMAACSLGQLLHVKSAVVLPASGVQCQGSMPDCYYTSAPLWSVRHQG